MLESLLIFPPGLPGKKALKNRNRGPEVYNAVTSVSLGASAESTGGASWLEGGEAVSTKGDNPCARGVDSSGVDVVERGLSFGEQERIFSSTRPEKGDSSGGAL